MRRLPSETPHSSGGTPYLSLLKFGTLSNLEVQPDAQTVYIIKIKIHSSCEIEYFMEIQLYKLCVILRSRVLRVVCIQKGYRPATLLATIV